MISWVVFSCTGRGLKLWGFSAWTLSASVINRLKAKVAIFKERISGVSWSVALLLATVSGAVGAVESAVTIAQLVLGRPAPALWVSGRGPYSRFIRPVFRALIHNGSVFPFLF